MSNGKQWLFVVASHRSGTNMLLKALTKDQSVRNLKEMFQITCNFQDERQELDSWRLPILRAAFHQDTFPQCVTQEIIHYSPTPSQYVCQQFINTMLYHGSLDEEGINTICTKILFQQCPPWYYNLWYWLYQQPIKLIYLRRKNMLDICVSIAVALRTQQWFLPQGSKVEQKLPGIRMTPRELLREFMFLRMCDDFFTVLTYKAPNAILVDYDTLVNNWDQEIQRIVGRLELDIDPSKVEMSSRRQIGNHTELIQNYDQLQKYFQDTPYHQFFQ